MNSSFKTLENQINIILAQLPQPNNLIINYEFSLILDKLNIPETAKTACLSIDTAMKHLDRISYYNYDRDAILIGDLLSAHYYQLLSELEDITFHMRMSQTIIKINELKSHIQHSKNDLSDYELYHTIFKIETMVIGALNDIFNLNQDVSYIYKQIMNQLKVEHLTYLVHHTEDEIRAIIDILQNKQFLMETKV